MPATSRSSVTPQATSETKWLEPQRSLDAEVTDLLELIGDQGKSFAEIRRIQCLLCNDSRPATTANHLNSLVEFGLLYRSSAGLYQRADIKGHRGSLSIDDPVTPSPEIDDFEEAASRMAPSVQKVCAGASVIAVKQGFERTAIFSPQNTGSNRISLEIVALGPGEEACPHEHVGSHTLIYTIGGSVRVYFGKQLEHSMEVGPGDSVSIPPGVIHYVVNEHAQVMEAVVARSPACREVIEYPHLREFITSVNSRSGEVCHA